jgi:ABC-2 type transport system permease protein
VTETLDLAPAPGAAPAATRVVRHALMEIRLLVRNGEQLLLALIIPLGVLVVSRLAGGRLGTLDQLGPSVLALAVWSTSFTSVAIATGFERRYGVLERLAATPLGRGGLLAGKSLGLVLIMLDQLVVLGLLGLILGWRPHFTLASALGAVALVVLATATFVCLALLLAGRVRAEASLGLANLIYVLALGGGALVIPLARYPAAVRQWIELLPTAALGEGLRAAAAGQVLVWAPLVLAGWLMVAAAGAWKGFRWIS